MIEGHLHSIESKDKVKAGVEPVAGDEYQMGLGLI